MIKGEIFSPLLFTAMLIPDYKMSDYRYEDENLEYHNDKFVENRVLALQANKYKCYYCGLEVSPDTDAAPHTLRASGYLEVHHKDNDHTNNNLDNLLVVCPFCHGVIHLGFNSHRYFFGILPGIKQEDVMLLCNLSAIGLYGQFSLEATLASHKIYQTFLHAGEKFYQTYNCKTEDYNKILFRLIKNGETEKVEKIFRQIKAIPNIDLFNKESFLWWSKHLVINCKAWDNIYKQIPSNLLI